jgi:hypothetical protein
MKFKPRLLLVIGFFVFSAGLVIGAQWYRLYLFPFPQLYNWKYPPEARVPLSEKMIITKYTAKTPVFVDRQYFDSIGDERLEGLFLVQIPRHYSDNIIIKAHSAITIYRFITDDNINTPFDSWTSSDIPINVRGWSTKHTRVVTKDFPAGKITLHPGGPVAASPILIKVHNYTAPFLEFEVLDQTEFIYTK